METITILRDLVVVFAVAVVVVALLRRIGVPAIAGFILAGALIGPNAFGLIKDVHRVEVLAEIGVVLLLFGIGLELSISHVRKLWRLVVFGGALQVGVAILAVSAVALGFGLPVGAAIFLGCVVAVSSTAIVLRGLRLRGEIDAPHGRLTLGILIFQDLCVIPMILAIPILAGAAGMDWGILIEIGQALGVLIAVLFVSRLLVTRILDLVARTRQRDLFVLSVFVICLGTAWVLSWVGLPLALGAFLAGIVVAGSGYRHQALSDLIPFREVLTSLFFVSVGMFINPLVFMRELGPVMSLLAAIVFGKFLVMAAVGTMLRLPTRVTVLSATALAQVGEFSFVLLSVARKTELVNQVPIEVLSLSIILSMLITPIAIASGRHVAAGVGKIRVLTNRLEVRTTEDLPAAFEKVEGHVIVAGYGVAGKELSYSLEDLGVPYVVVDLNPDNVRDAIQQLAPAYFGDVTSVEVIEQLGVERARELVIAVNDPSASERAIRAARQIAADVYILVRTQFVVDVEGLVAAGADEVVVSELEASAEITSRVLARHRVAKDAIDPQLDRIRHRTEE